MPCTQAYIGTSRFASQCPVISMLGSRANASAITTSFYTQVELSARLLIWVMSHITAEIYIPSKSPLNPKHCPSHLLTGIPI